MLLMVCAWCNWKLLGVRVPHILGVKRARLWGVSHGLCWRCLARELAKAGIR